MEKTVRRKLGLIGCMGSGKSRLARLYTEKYGGEAIDTDKMFVERYGEIGDFFKRFGEEEFRKKECELLVEAASSTATVVATGGGAVLSRRGMNALRENADIVYLTAPTETLAARIQKSDRPLKNKLEVVLAERAPLYEKYADYTIDTSVDSLVELENALKNKRKNRYDIVLVDSDETLLDYKAARKYALKNALDDLGVKIDIDKALDLFCPVTNEVWRRLELREITRDELLTIRETKFGEALGVKFGDGVFTERYRYHQRESRFVLDGVIRFLDGLKSRGVAVYVITNADTYCASGRLEPIAPHTDGVFISEEVGFDKPDARFFERVFSAIGNPNKNRVIVFGDGESSDIKGAANFGLDSCLFSPGGIVPTAADYVATSYGMFLDIL